MNWVKFLQKRPSDLQIRVGKVIFGLIIAILVYLNFFVFEQKNEIQDTWFWFIHFGDITKLVIIYILIAFGVIPFLTGLLDFYCMKSGKTRILQLIYAILLFFFSSMIVKTDSLDIGELLFFLALLPLFGGITGKFTTKKGLLYGIKKTKIRV